MAYNYAMGNSLWIVTPHNTIIVVDCPESVEVANVIREDMRRIPAIGNKPISFIIYTMYHGDHTFGARVGGIINSNSISMLENRFNHFWIDQEFYFNPRTAGWFLLRLQPEIGRAHV